MQFSYVKVTKWIKHQKQFRHLPWLRIGIYNPKNRSDVIYLLGLADSGSDSTIIDREIGENLGFSIEKGPREEITGVGGGTVKGHIHKAGFIIEDEDKKEDTIEYEDFVVFTESPFGDSHPQQTAIFGTVGFFRHTIVTFFYPRYIEVLANTS